MMKPLVGDTITVRIPTKLAKSASRRGFFRYELLQINEIIAAEYMCSVAGAKRPGDGNEKLVELAHAIGWDCTGEEERVTVATLTEHVNFLVEQASGKQ